MLMGCRSAVLAGSAIGFVGISFAFGLSLLAIDYAISGISGGHINPAVSISILAASKLSLKDTTLCITGHCVGTLSEQLYSTRSQQETQHIA